MLEWGRKYVSVILFHMSGRSAAWLARLPWEQEVGRSNRLAPTNPFLPQSEQFYSWTKAFSLDFEVWAYYWFNDLMTSIALTFGLLTFSLQLFCKCLVLCCMILPRKGGLSTDDPSPPIFVLSTGKVSKNGTEQVAVLLNGEKWSKKEIIVIQ